MNDLKIRALIGMEANPFIRDLAGLRIKLFREYLYLYNGALEYEEHHLKSYTDSGESPWLNMLQYEP